MLSCPIPPRRAARRSAVLAVALLPIVTVLALPAAASTTSNEIVYISDPDGNGLGSVVLRDLSSRTTTTVLPDDAQGSLYEDPELSPDGGSIALATDRGLGADAGSAIQVSSRSGQLRAVTTPPKGQFDISPAWSPDGQTLLFSRLTVDSAGTLTALGLYTVPAAGGAPTEVPGQQNGFAGDWSPDATGGAGSIVYTAVTDLKTGSGTLQVLDRGTGATRSLNVNDALYPAWSPDGSTIAYQRTTVRDTSSAGADTVQIGTVNADGTGGRDLGVTKLGDRSVAEYPSWSPDSQSIFYDAFAVAADGTGQFGGLYAVDRTGVRAGTLLDAAKVDESAVFAQGPAPAPVAGAGAASTFIPVTPVRIFDTRDGTGRTGSGKVAAGGTETLQITGSRVPANASAVVLNITAVNVSANTDVRAYPAGGAVPTVSNLNASKGQVVPNLVTVRIGAGGQVVLRNSGGTVDLFADLAGYYLPDASGQGFSSVDPVRILNTLPSSQGGDNRRVESGAPRDLKVTGTFSRTDGGTVTVPDDASAVVLNVTGTGSSASTDVRVYPVSGDTVPTVSNLNLVRGQTAANLVTTAVGAGGTVRLRTASGSVALIADLAGYYAKSAPGRFVPITPARFLDTRDATGAAPIPTTGGGYVDLKVSGARGVPANATTAVLNLTGTGPSATTDVRAYPADTTSRVPFVSNLNLVAGLTRANAAIVPTGLDGRVRIRNNSGSVQLIADLAGWFVSGP